MKSGIITGTAITLFVALLIVPGLAAQTFTNLFNFDKTDGANPYGGLVQATNGDFYGTTSEGGANTDKLCDSGFGGSCGTVFKITPSGALSTLYSFCSQSNCTDGANSNGALIQATDGNFYGTTAGGGVSDKICSYEGCGTIFRITPSGTLTTLYTFCSQSGCTDGRIPSAGLVQATDGIFYGTTYDGGANDEGTVFKITPSGTLTTLHSFEFTDGYNPTAALIQATDGNFYGTTYVGGTGASCTVNQGCGTVFKITPGGTLTTLYSFCSQIHCTDGLDPEAALVQGTDGNFYGTTFYGGANFFYIDGGTVFKLTPTGTLTTLYSFCSLRHCTDGANPEAALVQATDDNFYGTTPGGGASTNCFGGGCGTVFRITATGMRTTLQNFDGFDGDGPGLLVQATNGNFYGVTGTGGVNVDGTVFSLSVGLGPFVKTLPASGKIGAPVGILGTDLTGATSVTFNGTPATFTVGSASIVKTTVPAGATTGTVQVVTPAGTLTSNVNFQVLP